ncbi:putative Dynactin subunit 6 [Hypsibius exemplaris]|uniref:Dynactin subunit 6 n=1 Tax=Hypsibius exemplaris TaxID=2072580 RepID=A0A1W0WYG0_HYPEX|nr:putative Dynactin subunit 6 [Hypsibius exemplaris]
MSTPSPAPRPVAPSESDSRSLLAPPGVIILPKAVVPREIELKGEITIGSRTVLHPSSKILAINGPIVIGEGNIIEEKTEIRNNFPPDKDGTKKTLYIGNRNLFETYAVIEGNVGNNNTVSSKARIGHRTTLSTGCMIGCMCVLDSDETLPPDTVITGENQNRRIAETPQAPPFIDEHLEHLIRQLPNYHYILKSSAG